MRISAGVLGTLCCLASVACARQVPRPPYVPQPSSALAEVTQPPPPARVEVVPDAPGVRTAIWIDGEWSWRLGRWAWLPGRWVTPPAGAAFSPWVFERAKDGRLLYAPGVWRDAEGHPVDPPAVLGYATVQSGAVVNADGTTELTGPTIRQRPASETTSP